MQRIREKKHATRVKTENFGINRRDTLVRRIRSLFGFYSLGQTVAKSHAPSADQLCPPTTGTGTTERQPGRYLGVPNLRQVPGRKQKKIRFTSVFDRAKRDLGVLTRLFGITFVCPSVIAYGNTRSDNQCQHSISTVDRTVQTIW